MFSLCLSEPISRLALREHGPSFSIALRPLSAFFAPIFSPWFLQYFEMIGLTPLLQLTSSGIVTFFFSLSPTTHFIPETKKKKDPSALKCQSFLVHLSSTALHLSIQGKRENNKINAASTKFDPLLIINSIIPNTSTPPLLLPPSLHSFIFSHNITL